MTSSDNPVSLLSIDNLRVRLRTDRGDVDALNDVSLTVERGHVLGVVGESGSGKSLLAQTICRLIEAPFATVTGRMQLSAASGLVDLVAQHPRGNAMRRLRGRELAMIFQEPTRALHPMFTVGKQIDEAVRHRGDDRQPARSVALSLLARVGLPDPERAYNSYPHQLSGGMRQRVMIAIALAARPSLLIADEPTTALDVTIQAQILELLQELRAEFGMSIIMISHDLGVVAEMADCIAVMYLGEVVEFGPAARVLASPVHPYTQGLMNATPRLSTKPKTTLSTLAGTVPPVGPALTSCVFVDRCPHVRALCREKPPIVQDGDRNAKCWMPTQRWEHT